ncbi:hypothetical protein IAT40_003516 [Kwoniella sp. CBS 6097]
MERLTWTLEQVGSVGRLSMADGGHWKRMEAHPSTTEDSKDILERNATAFHAVLGVALSLITLICFYALYRGSQRPFLPSCVRRHKQKQSRSRRGSIASSSNNALGRAASRSTIHVDNVYIPSTLGPTPPGGGGMWAGSMPSPNLLTDGAREKKGMWRKTAYLTDLKRAEEALREQYQDQRSDSQHQHQFQNQHQHQQHPYQHQHQSQNSVYGRGVASTDVSRDKVSGEWGYFAQQPHSYLQPSSVGDDPSNSNARLNSTVNPNGLPLITSKIPSPTFLQPQTSSPSYPYIVENRLSSGIRSATASLAQTSMDISRAASKSAVSLPLSQYSNIDAVTSFSRKSTSSIGNGITYPPGAAPPITPDQASIINKLESRSSYDLLRPLNQSGPESGSGNVATSPGAASSLSLPLSLSIPPSMSSNVSLPQAQMQAYSHSRSQVDLHHQGPETDQHQWTDVNGSAINITPPEPIYEAGRTRTRERTISMGSIAFPQPEPYSVSPRTGQFRSPNSPGQQQQPPSASPQSAKSENRYSNLFAYAILNDIHNNEQGVDNGYNIGVQGYEQNSSHLDATQDHTTTSPVSILRPGPSPIQPEFHSPVQNSTSPSSSHSSSSPSSGSSSSRSPSYSPPGGSYNNGSGIIDGASRPFPTGQYSASSPVARSPPSSSPSPSQVHPQPGPSMRSHRQPSSQSQSYTRPPRKSAQYSIKSPRPSTSSLTPSKLRYSLTIASSSPPATSASRRFENTDGYLSPPRASMSGGGFNFGRRSGSVDSQRAGPPRIDFVDQRLGGGMGRPPSTYGYAM